MNNYFTKAKTLALVTLLKTKMVTVASDVKGLKVD